MKYTCVECLFHYDNLSGDVEERMCYECIDEISEKYSKENDNE